MRKYPAFLLFFLISLTGSYGQRQKAFISAADSAYANKSYYSAFKYYEVALEYDSSRMDLWYKYANAARQFNAYPYAEAAYERVLSAAADTSLYGPSTYYLAVVEQRQGKYAEAREHYRTFLNRYSPQAPDLTEPARQGLADAEWAIAALNEPPRDSIRHLGPEINTPYSEFGASLLNDTLYYSSFRFEYEKDLHNPPRLYIKVLRSAGGLEGEVLPGDFNRDGHHTANTSFSPDGNAVYFTICEYTTGSKVRCDLYRRERLPDGVWGEAVKLGVNADGYTTTQPAVGQNPATGETTLYFASDRPGGQGGLDIWFSVLQDDGTFQPAENLADLNRGGDETTPFFHNLSQQLFFSSDGYLGFGGLDVYRTRRDSSGAWTTPEHLAHPVNSSYNDVYYVLNSEGSRAFFSSDRLGSAYIEPDKEACCYDIYSADIDINIDLLARTFNTLDRNPLIDVTVSLYEITPDGEEILVQTITNPQGNDFNFPLQRYKNYRIDARREGFQPVSVPLDLRNREFTTSTTIEQDLFLTPETVELQALTFDAEDRSPLPGATVQLLELVDGEPRLIAEKFNPDSNDFLFPLEIGKTYIITADKPGYKPLADTIRFTPEDIARLGRRPTVELYLERDGFEDFLPLALYFDNDMPDRRSYSPTTDKTYGQTYEAYYDRKVEYVTRFTEGLSANDSFLVARRYEDFFEREVKGGNLDLQAFTERVLPFLKQGNSITIRLKGYSSPRASSGYNLTLSRRRINSVYNHFRQFDQGSLQPYIKNGQLKIEEEAFGESTAKGVSDSIQDEKNSIYNILAAVERRVEIVEVSTSEEENPTLTSPDR